MTADLSVLLDQLKEETCPVCGHEWSRHDPEDGKCDAGTPGALDYFEWDKQGRIDLPCPCGRHASYTAMRNAKLSRAALASLPQAKEEKA